MFLYETHLHTSPVSRCGHADVRENLSFYKSIGYEGVFITNHFLDGNINIDKTLPYQEKLEFYVSDYYAAKELEKEIGIRVFFGVEMANKGTDFLIYGLSPEWYRDHPEIIEMKKSASLPFLKENGALIIQAHPFRESSYIDHIRLYPRCVHGVEIINSSRNDFENGMAKLYAEWYSLFPFAGSDNHDAGNRGNLAGMAFSTPIADEQDFARRILAKEGEIFRKNL